MLLEDFAPIKETMKVEIPQEMLPGVLQDNNNPTEPTIPFRVDSCGYLGEFLHAGKLKAIVNSTIATIRKSGIQFDTIAFTGVSGALVAPAVCMEFNVVPTVIRKNGEGNHSGRNFEGLRGEFRYIVVDDGIAEGRTLDRIITTIRKDSPKAVFAGFFGYCQEGFWGLMRPPKEFKIGKTFWFHNADGSWKEQKEELTPSEAIRGLTI